MSDQKKHDQLEATEEITRLDYIVSDDDWVYDFAMLCKGVVYCTEITDSEFRTYCVIRSMVNGQKAVAWPSYETIAELSGHSKRTAIRNVAKLESLDLIQKIPRTGTSNYFKIKKKQNSSVLRNEDDIQEWMENQFDKRSKKPANPPKSPADPPGKPDKDADDGVPIADVIKYLNEKAGKKLNPMTENNRKDIRSRWKECRKNNMSENEIKRIFVRIIDLKVAQFSGKIFEDRNNPGKPGKPGEFFLKPVNLFNQKNFVKYCDEIDLIDQGKMVDGQATAQPSAPAQKPVSANNRQNQNQAVLDQLRKKYAQGAQQ